MTEIIDQPNPKKGEGVPIWDLVIKDVSNKRNKYMHILTKVTTDMKDRDDIGFNRYGTRLFSFNGRNALIDAYQEFLDGAVYLRQALEELANPHCNNREVSNTMLSIYNQHLENLITLRELIE